MSALLLCIVPSVFGQEDELKQQQKEENDKKQRYIVNTEKTKRTL